MNGCLAQHNEEHMWMLVHFFFRCLVVGQYHHFLRQADGIHDANVLLLATRSQVI